MQKKIYNDYDDAYLKYEQYWDKVGKIGKECGLKWGNSFGDNPYFYLDE